jgi:hypothetical protein
MIQPSVHKRDIGIEPYGCGGELGLIGRPSGTYLRDDAATHFLERSALLARSYCCQLDDKRLHILHETLPDSRRIAALAIDEQRDSPNVTAVKEAADHAGVELIPLYAAKPDDYAPAFAAVRDAGADGLQIISAPELVAAASGLAALAIVSRLPTICEWAEMAQSGCLLGYGPDFTELEHRVANFRGAHLPRHRTGGIADRRTDPLQIRHQLEDGQSNRTDDPAIFLGPLRRGDRIATLFAAVHESADGTFRTSRGVRLESGMRTKADVRRPL